MTSMDVALVIDDVPIISFRRAPLVDRDSLLQIGIFERKQKTLKNDIKWDALYLQGVPHHTRSVIGLNYDFRD